MRFQLVLWCLVFTACERSAAPGTSDSWQPWDAQRGILASPSGAERPFARRIDGSIQRRFPGAVTGKALEYVVITGYRAGAEQCAVLIFDGETGELRTSYRPRTKTPWRLGRTRHSVDGYDRVLTCPNPALFHLHRYGGKRYLLVVSAATTAPSNLALLEVTPEGLAERFVFWNYGHIHEVLFHDPWLVVFGVNNELESSTWGMSHYSPIVAVFRLDEILREQTQVAVSPVSDEQPGTGWNQYIAGSSDRDHGFAFVLPDARIEGHVLTARTGSRLIYTVDLESGHTKIRPSKAFERDYAERRIPNRPPLDRHVEELNRSVRTFVRR